MALTSVIPASGSIVATGDLVTVTADDAGGIVSITHVRTGSGGTNEVIYTDAGGYQTGFTGSYVESGSATAAFRRDAGWDSSPFRLDITTAGNTYSINYTLQVEGQYPPDMQPFNDPIDGGGGSAITVTDEGGDPLTADVTSFDFVGSGVTASGVGDDITITVPGPPVGTEGIFGSIETDGVGGYTLSANSQGVASATLQLAEVRLDFDTSFGDDDFPVQVTRANRSGQILSTSDNIVTYAKDASGDYVVLRLFDAAGAYINPQTNAVGFDFFIGGTAGGSGDVSSSESQGTIEDNEIVVFDGTTGKLIQGGGSLLVDGSLFVDDLTMTGSATLLGRVNLITAGEALRTKEGAAPGEPGGSSLHGQFWTKSAAATGEAQNRPYFTADDGTEYDLSEGTGTGGDVSSSESLGTVYDTELVVFDGITGKLIEGAGAGVYAGNGNVTADTLSAANWVGSAKMLISDPSPTLEIADHITGRPVGTGGAGRYWTKAPGDSPVTPDNRPYFTSDDDTEYDLTAGAGSSIEVVDDTDGSGTTLTTDLTKWTLKGAGWSIVEPVEGEIEVTVAPGAAPVDSWGPAGFPRVGVIVPIASDYDASQIDNDAADVNGNVTGAFVSIALDTADVAIESAQSDATSAQSDATSAKTKTDYLTITGSVDLDVMDTDVAANNAKITYDDAATVASNTSKLVNVATSISSVGAALVEDATVEDQRATLGLGSAAVEDAGATIDDLVQLINKGGSPALPAVDGSNLTGLYTGTPITVIDESTELTTNVNQFTFAGSGVVATEPDPGSNEILVTISGTAGAIDIVGSPDTVTGADLLEFDATAFTVTDQTGDDALVAPVFNTTAGTIAEGDHTHETLVGIDNSSGDGVILGRDAAGTGESEELTPAQARAIIDVSVGNLGPGTHQMLDLAIADRNLTADGNTLDAIGTTPADFSGLGNSILRVNTGETGLEYAASPVGVTAGGQLSAAQLSSTGNLTVADTTLIEEISAPLAPGGVPGQGQIYVKDDSPNTLKFVDDDGTEFDLCNQTRRHFPTQLFESPVAADNVRWFKTPVAITIQGIDASVTGTSPDADFTIYHATTRDAAGTVVHTADTITSTSGTGFTSPSGDDTIPAGNYVWTEIDVIAGTVDTLELTMHYTED
jgi:hypothetical protein